MTFGAAGVFVQTQTATAATVASFSSQAVGSNWAVTSGSTSVAAMAASPMADWCVIQYEFNVANCGLWVTTDGGVTAGATVGGQSCIYIPPMETFTTASAGQAVISNIQAQYNWNVQSGTATYYSGNENKGATGIATFAVNDQSYATARTSQSGNTGVHLWNVAPNWVSWIADAATVTGHVTVTFQ
jgi:hypothetical protein